MEITAEVKSIENLKDFFFVVPDYQREYVWSADIQVARFLQDINDEFKPNAKKQTNYFIGSTIIVKREGESSFDVIDGQQRLTTIVLSLCAIRKALKNMNCEEDEIKVLNSELLKVVNELLYKFDITTRKHTPRLSLQYEESKDYLNTLIAENDFTENDTPSITKMKQA